MFSPAAFGETYACGDFVIKREGNYFSQYSTVSNTRNQYAIFKEDKNLLLLTRDQSIRLVVVAIDKQKKSYTLTIIDPRPRPTNTPLERVQVGGRCAFIP